MKPPVVNPLTSLRFGRQHGRKGFSATPDWMHQPEKSFSPLQNGGHQLPRHLNGHCASYVGCFWRWLENGVTSQLTTRSERLKLADNQTTLRA
jgi:hypothetical protein